jgi:hypothetical protein
MNIFLKYAPIIATVIGTISAALITPEFVGAHPVVFAILNALAMILHAALPSVFTAK